MPASSKSQQRFFGVVKAMQKGDIPKKGKAGKIAKQMTKKDVDDFASTKHKGKPEKVKREMKVRNLIKKMVREELAKMNEGTCGYGENGELGEEPAGPHLIKKKKIDEKMDRKKAAIILKQIGGNRFIAMTGAKGFAFSNKYMSFKIGRNSKGINFVRIGHNSKDLYDMEFGFVSVKGIKVKKKVKDVYADMLGTIFTKYTGMRTSLWLIWKI